MEYAKFGGEDVGTGRERLFKWTSACSVVAILLALAALMSTGAPQTEENTRQFAWGVASGENQDGVSVTIFSGPYGWVSDVRRPVHAAESGISFMCPEGNQDCELYTITTKRTGFADADCPDEEACESCASASDSTWTTGAAGILMMLVSLYNQRMRAAGEDTSARRTAGLLSSFVAACSLLNALVVYYKHCFAHPPAAVQELNVQLSSTLGNGWYIMVLAFLNEFVVMCAHVATPVLQGLGHPGLAAQLTRETHSLPMFRTAPSPPVAPASSEAVPKFWPFGGKKADFVLVGCGAPGRGMGWYHAVQLLDGQVPHGRLSKVVEPWFLGGGAKGPGGPEFNEWAKEVSCEHGTEFHTSLAAAFPAGEKQKNPWIALVSGRTADNPRILREAITAGCSAVYLEKPGAPSVQELEGMKAYAARAGVPVFMGYNKNVCKYVSNARNYASKKPGSLTTFVSNNAYAPDELGECFERNAEGMLKNMAVHELALLVTFYGVTVENIASVEPDMAYSSVQTLEGPSGQTWTDFDKIGFTVTTKTGQSATVKADRCGGVVSWAAVTDPASDKELFRHSMPDKKDEVFVDKMLKNHPDWMPYFFTQHKDYIALKDRVANFIVNGKDPEGVATIDIAVETLRLAEHLTPLLKQRLQEVY